MREPTTAHTDWKQVFRALGDMAMILDRDRVVLAVNPAMERATGLREAEARGRRCHEVLRCTDPSSEHCPHAVLIRSGRPEAVEREVKVCAGTLLVTVTPILDAVGAVSRTIHIAKDITKWKQDSEELRRKNRALAALGRCNHALVHAEDERAFVQGICDILVRWGGYRLAWVGYRNDDRTVHPVAHCGFEDGYLEKLRITWDDGERGRGPTGTAIRTGKPVVCRDIHTDPGFLPWRREALARGYASSIALPLHGGGRCLGALNLYAEEPDAFDAEETRLLAELADDLGYGIAALRTKKAHEEAQRALAESEEKYRRLVETANDAIFLADAETGTILDANRAAEQLLGASRDEIVGMHQSGLHPPEERRRYARIFREHVETGKVISEEFFVQRRDGGRVPVQVSANTLRLGEREVIQGIFRDRSAIRRAEAQLRQAQKLEAIGILAGGIAHDFNNLLSPILGYTELAMLRLPHDHPARRCLAEVLAAANRAGELVRQILTFSRKGTAERRPLLLQPLVTETVKFLRSSIPASVEIHTEIDPEAGPVLCDPTEIHQILMNLCTNAYQALGPDGGVIGISLERLRPRPANRPDGTGPGDGGRIRLCVTDNGRGIAPDVIDRIFEPYFSTKPKGEGTGLGLALVHGIVESYGGRIEVSSRPGEGTRFSVELPAAETDAPAGEDPADPVPASGTGRILVVDDNGQVAAVTAGLLQDLGYEVLTRSGGREALELFRHGPGAFDLVLADHSMPGLSGLELGKRLLEMRPGLPILLYTGHADAELVEEARAAGVRGVLTKPVTRHDLARAVGDILARR